LGDERVTVPRLTVQIRSKTPDSCGFKSRNQRPRNFGCRVALRRSVLDTAQKSRASSKPPDRWPTEGRQHHLLCVDDEKTLVSLTATILAGQGYRVTALTNPFQAMEVFKREKIELVILDYQMPGMSGTSLAAQLKTTHSKVKVVLFTGTPDVPRCELSPVDAIVSKSDGVEVLIATVNRFLHAG
jgi:CheY-like chemotaxis protein